MSFLKRLHKDESGQDRLLPAVTCSLSNICRRLIEFVSLRDLLRHLAWSTEDAPLDL